MAAKTVTPGRLLEAFYRRLYRRFGGRPWTYILRDIWHELEYLPGCLLFASGFAAGRFFGWEALLAGWAVFTFGYIAGHLFWGTPWRRGQADEMVTRTAARRPARTVRR
jgi:hypothetical protein